MDIARQHKKFKIEINLFVYFLKLYLRLKKGQLKKKDKSSNLKNYFICFSMLTRLDKKQETVNNKKLSTNEPFN